MGHPAGMMTSREPGSGEVEIKVHTLPQRTREGWGTRPVSPAKVKSVGQECPTHTCKAGSTRAHQVPSLRRIIRFANNPALVGMTGCGGWFRHGWRPHPFKPQTKGVGQECPTHTFPISRARFLVFCARSGIPQIRSALPISNSACLESLLRRACPAQCSTLSYELG